MTYLRRLAISAIAVLACAAPAVAQELIPGTEDVYRIGDGVEPGAAGVLLQALSNNLKVGVLAVRSGNKSLYLLLEGLRAWIDELEFEREFYVHRTSPDWPGCVCAVARRLGRGDPKPSELELVDEEPTEREGIKLLHYRCPRCESDWRFKFVEDAFDGAAL